MSYHDYLKMIGSTPREDIPRVSIDCNEPRFEGYATLYLHPETLKPMCVAWYLWAGDDDEACIREKYLELGHDLSNLTRVGGGQGHYTMTEPE